MDIYQAIADPTRRHIVERLGGGPRSAGELAEGLPVSQPAVSKHLRLLREAGLVRQEVRRQQRIYSLNPGPLLEVERWVGKYTRFWNERLDRLEQLVKEPPKKATRKGGKP